MSGALMASGERPDAEITVIGGGLAGCEAAWQAARAGCRVRLYDMKPEKKTPAHHSPLLGELVCSNSLRSNDPETAAGLLKEELRRLSSLVMEAADESAIPAGSALAVDRERFAACLTGRLRENRRIEILQEEITEIPPKGIVILATGPLTSEPLCKAIVRLLGETPETAADSAAEAADSAAEAAVKKAAEIAVKIATNPPEMEIGQTATDPTAVATDPTAVAAVIKMAEMAATKNPCLAFYDAAAPIVDASTVDPEITFLAARYGKGDPSYRNCPMTKEQYDAFCTALLQAKTAPLHGPEESDENFAVFEGCMPVEVMAARGADTLRHGPMKPVGLPLPSSGKEAYAVVQLRPENREGSMYNLVGFQTHLTFPEQERVFRMIPGLEKAEFLRYGVMHRNTFLHSPGLLSRSYALLKEPRLFFAGQITGVEGYIPSACSGLVAGVNAARLALGLSPLLFPAVTEIGALARYVETGGLSKFQPMNANFGILDPLPEKVKGGKAARNRAIALRSLAAIDALRDSLFAQKQA